MQSIVGIWFLGLAICPAALAAILMGDRMLVNYQNKLDIWQALIGRPRPAVCRVICHVCLIWHYTLYRCTLSIPIRAPPPITGNWTWMKGKLWLRLGARTMPSPGRGSMTSLKTLYSLYSPTKLLTMANGNLKEKLRVGRIVIRRERLKGEWWHDCQQWCVRQTGRPPKMKMCGRRKGNWNLVTSWMLVCLNMGLIFVSSGLFIWW